MREQYWPVLSGTQIDERAEVVLSDHAPQRLLTPGFTQVEEIAWNLSEECELKVAMVGSIEGEILGKFILDPPLILIAKAELGQEARYRFTVAHELGHFFLHRDLQFPDSTGQKEFIDTKSELESTLDKRELRSGPDWLEWQANRFAAGLLMPRGPFLARLVEVQEQLGITTNRGFVFVENKTYSVNDLSDTLDGLAATFRVSRVAAQIRPRDLGRLSDSRGPEATQLFSTRH